MKSSCFCEGSNLFSTLLPLSPLAMQSTWWTRWRGGASLRNLFASVPSLHLGHLSPHPRHPRPSDTRVRNPTQLPLRLREWINEYPFPHWCSIMWRYTEKVVVSLCSTPPCVLSAELQVCVSSTGLCVLQVTASLWISVSRSYNYLRDWWRKEEKLMCAVYSL